MSTPLKQKNSGFTIVELMIALAIFSIVSLMIMKIYVDTSKTYVSSLASRNAQQNLRTSMDVITRYAKQARSADWNAASGILSLNVENDDGSIYQVDFSWETDSPSNPNRVIKMVVQNASAGTTIVPKSRLSSNELDITNFDVIPSPGIPAVLNISLRTQFSTLLQGYEKGAAGDNTIQIKTTVLLKG